MPTRLTTANGVLAIAVMLAALIDEPLPRLPPLEPRDAIHSFAVQPGFRVELVASEPLIRSPVAIDFDENGRLFVAEYPEYNQQGAAGPIERGCVKMLRDTDGDGQYDQATIYVDNLPTPVALACWNGGIFVGAPPDLWYCRDSRGDGRADLRRRVLTGFDRDKAGEAMLNSMRWIPANRYLIATGLAGGRVRRPDQPESAGVSVRNRNLLLDPRSETVSATSGGGQHGLTVSDWGDVFTCDNSRPVLHVTYDSRYLERNPLMVARPALAEIYPGGPKSRLYRISPPEPWRAVRTRLRVEKRFDGPDEGGQPFGFFTGASGLTIFRGDAWPNRGSTEAFIGDVANNVVHRLFLAERGLRWTAERADADHEFLASRDVWFRPVQFATGPDGAMYVVDMYRALIETIESMPPELVKQTDVAGGIQRGRIFRVVPEGFRRPAAPRLGGVPTGELVATLSDANGWRRDTAARLIYQRRDSAAIEPLRALQRTAADPRARMLTLRCLDGLHAAGPAEVTRGLSDADPRVRKDAILVAEDHAEDPAIRSALTSLSEDPDGRVVRQLAFSLGGIPGDHAESLARILLRNRDESIQFAALSSAARCRAELLDRLARDAEFASSTAGMGVLVELVRQALIAQEASQSARIGGLLDATAESNQRLLEAAADVALDLPRNAVLPGRRLPERVAKRTVEALAMAERESASPAESIAALRSLGRAAWNDVRPIVETCLRPQRAAEVQRAAIELIGRFDEPDGAAAILTVWSTLTPPVRATAADILLSRARSRSALLDAVGRGIVRRGDIDPAHVQQLLRTPDETLRARAAALFAGSTSSERLAVVDHYRAALKRAGNSERGREVFRRACAGCHRLDQEGAAVGPDLATIRGQSQESVLLNILDPNREVLPKYFVYNLTTIAGVTITGMLLDESPTSVIIRRIDGTSVTVRRTEIDSLISTGVSAMPDGLESQIDVEGMADLLAYLLKPR